MKIIKIILCVLWLVKDSHENRVRLANGKTPNEGFIQIKINDTTWGTMLNYVFTSYRNEPFLSAFVVCRMLNYSMAIKVKAVSYDPYAANNTYWPKAVGCRGSEKTISDCPDLFDYYEVLKPPPPKKAVYVVCGNLSQVDQVLQVRLNGTNQRNYGIVELRNKSDEAAGWKWLCEWYGSTWDKNDANVVCKMLGYKRAVGRFLFNNTAESKKLSSSSPRSYECQGTEARIEECAQYDSRLCFKRDYSAGAFCDNNETPPPVQYRLNSKKEPNIGFLEVKHRNVWGSVCSILTRSTSDFICRQLGFLGLESMKQPSGPPRKTVVSWELNEACHISNDGNCSHGELWRIHYSPCTSYIYNSTYIVCKVASAPSYRFYGGCSPRVLVINRKGLSDKEKQLITYYQVILTERYNYNKKWAEFYIAGDTADLTLGDNKTYVRGLNRPLENEKEYYVTMTAVYEDENGNLGYGQSTRKILGYYCPTAQETTTSSSTRSSNEQGPHMVHTSLVHHSNYKASDKSLSTLEIMGIVIGALLAIVIVAALIIIHRKRNTSPPQRPEELKLNPVIEDQQA